MRVAIGMLILLLGSAAPGAANIPCPPADRLVAPPALPADDASWQPDRRYRLRLHVVSQPPETALVTGAMEEAARIWRDAGIDVTWSAVAPVDEPWDILVRVLFDDGPVALRPEGPALGRIDFIGGTIPRDIVHLSMPRARALLADAARLDDALAGRADLRAAFLGRTLGRALAHEIGHYLMASPGHAPAGLMRPAYTTSELLDAGPAAFALAAGEAWLAHAGIAAAMNTCPLPRQPGAGLLFASR